MEGSTPSTKAASSEAKSRSPSFSSSAHCGSVTSAKNYIELGELLSRGEVHAAAELSSNFEASLRAHERILDKLTEVRAAAGADIEALRAKVKSKGDAAAEARQTAEARISGRAAASVHAEEVQPTQSQAPSPTSRAAAERRFEEAEAKLGARA